MLNKDVKEGAAAGAAVEEKKASAQPSAAETVIQTAAPAPVGEMALEKEAIDPSQFGIFGTATITQENDWTKVVVPLGVGKMTLDIPTAVAVAWISDNVAGKALADAKKSKVS